MESGVLEVTSIARPFMNFFKRKGIKTLFFLVDDLWLYNFHKQDYDGIIYNVFQTIKFIEDKQW